MADFNSFGEVEIYIKKSSWRLTNAVHTSLSAVWRYVQGIIRSKHGVQQPGRPSSLSSSPLKKSWDLQNAVAYKVNIGSNSVELYSKKDWLAVIHEYGVTFRMTEKQRKYLFAVVFKDSEMKSSTWPKKPGYITIPARPIRRVVLSDPTVKEGADTIIDRALEKVFI